MNYRKILTVTLFVLAALTVSAQKGKKKATGPNQAEIQASKVIEYTNAVIDLNNRTNKVLKSYNSVLKAGDEKYEQLSKNYDSRFPVSFTQTKYPVPAGYVAQYEEAQAKTVSFPEKADIIKSVDIARENVKRLEEWSDRIGRYYKDKEFEKDNLEGYLSMRDSLMYYMKSSKNAWHTAVNKASDAGGAAEIVILKKSPIADFIIPMKTDLKSLEGVLDDFYSSLEDNSAENTDYSALKEKINALNSTFEKNKDTTGKKVSAMSGSRLSNYDYFYSKAAECTKYVSAAIDELSKENSDESRLQNTFSLISQEYNSLIGIYNSIASN